ncbi:MAG TPA: GlsB/YeaQ/YmgE family stress response membrane protein [Thermoanaerobaculia bacterium]|nr:GlsB/YeaQ/YmgE family stress response membrane protein [Thermoanaerobaculia bacterium]
MWLIVELALCALAGWATGQIMKGAGYGLLGDVVLGIVGGWFGGLLFGGFVTGGLLGEFLVRLVGAILAVVLVRFILKRI